MKAPTSRAIESIAGQAIAIVAWILFCLLFWVEASAQQKDPFEGVPPHNVPRCTPTGKGKAAAKCGCTGMVQEVHEAIALSCWREVGVTGRPPEILLNFPPPTVLECMEKNHADHCQIVADAWQFQSKYSINVDTKKQCRTSCKPERCGCADSACAAHGQGGGY